MFNFFLNPLNLQFSPHWNFVSSRKERIEQAKEDWKQGRILLPPTDNEEFIPLPQDNSKPAGGPPPGVLS